MADYILAERRTSTVAFDVDTDERIGCFDRTAGASRGTIRARVVADTFAAWVAALDAL